MIHTAHRFADEAAMRTALGAQEPEALDVIGIARTRGVENSDGEVVTASVELAGWHVNAVWEGAVHAAWTASVIPPMDAPRWWSGVPVEAASVPAPDILTLLASVDAAIEAVARSMTYSSALHCISYLNGPNEAWAAEAAAFLVWRNAVWVAALTLNPASPPASVEAALALLPTWTRPS